MAIKTKQQKKRNQFFTFMLVPHDGKAVRSIRIPVKLLQLSAALCCVLMVASLGAFLNYRHTVAAATSEKAELEVLRQNNGNQLQQIEQLAKSTASLQADMERLNNLDSEVRRMMNLEESSTTSRAGTVRPNLNANGGQGGPSAKPTLEQLNQMTAAMKENMKNREASLEELKGEIKAKQSRMAATPSIWPTSGDVTSRFGWRGSPWGGGGSDWHPGIDIANSVGTPILATADGEVAFSGWYSGYGKLVQITHSGGIETLYGHNSQLAVQVGQRVKKGEVIAYMGNTGYSTGSHCHYEVRVNGTAVNPASFLN